MREYLIACKQIEEIVGNLYQQLASNRSYVAEIRRLFQNLSNDERTQGRLTDLVLQTPAKDLQATPMISEDELQQIKANVEALLRKVEREDVDEHTALEMALYMETHFAKVRVHNAFHFRNTKLAEFFDRLAVKDEAHVNTMNQCFIWAHAKCSWPHDDTGYSYVAN